MKEETQTKKEDYISLFEAAKLCSYSEPYLRLRARAGKLKSIKLGKKWMTTALWLKEYEDRVAEWRQATEAKKAVPAAVLVSAPESLVKNLVQAESEEINEIKASNPIEPALTRQITATPVQDFAEGTDFPIVPAQKPLAKFATGQIFPVPEQSKEAQAESGDHVVWLGALVTGAISALVLAFAVSGGIGVTDIASTAQKFSQANTSQPVLSEVNVSEKGQSASEVEAGYRIDIADLKSQFSSENLEEFVNKVADFINNFNISGW